VERSHGVLCLVYRRVVAPGLRQFRWSLLQLSESDIAHSFLSIAARAQLNPATQRVALRLATDGAPVPLVGGRRNQRGTTLCLMNLAVSRIHPGGHGQHTAAANFAEFVEVLSRKPLPVLVKLGSGRVCRNPSRPRLRREVSNRVPLRLKMLYISSAPRPGDPAAATHLSGRKTQRV
jgi:hypothetical protein